MRCSPLATDGGASICTTRSIAPMSMPSSSDEVATSAAQRAGLEQVLDLDALRPRDRSVVRAHQRLAGELVQRAGQPLGQPPAVDEDQRRPVRADELEQPRVDGRPRSTAARRPPRCRAARDLDRPGRRLAMSSTGTSMVSSSGLSLPGVDDGDRPVADGAADVENSSSISLVRCSRRRRLGGVAAFARPLRSPDERERRRRRGSAPPRRAGAASPTGRCAAAGVAQMRLEPLERERQVRAALGRHQRVDLVDDDRLDRAQRLARVRGQQQVERLRRGDQDVGRLALKARALGLRRVAGADGDGRGDERRRRGRSAACAMPASGARRLRSTSTASALSGET